MEPTLSLSLGTNYSPAVREELAATLATLTHDELLALVPDTKQKSPEAKQLLLAELKSRVSPNRKP